MITEKKLKEIRIASGQTQAELAKKLGKGGYDRFAISKIERGKVKVGLEVAQKWAAACGYKIEFLKI
jgi:transcriptional regulator with XRE-family HTH domain